MKVEISIKHADLNKRIDAVEEKIQTEVQSLKTSVEEMVTEEVKKAKKRIEDEVNESVRFLEESLKDKMAEIKEHAIFNEQYSRKSSVRIFGVEESQDENVEEKVTTFFNEILQTEVKSEDIDICHRIGKPSMPNMPPTRRKQRPIIVKFTSHKMKSAVMRKKKDLKDTGYGMAEDLTYEIYKRLSDIKKLDSIEKCWSVDGKIRFIKKGERAINIIKNGRDVEKLLAGE